MKNPYGLGVGNRFGSGGTRKKVWTGVPPAPKVWMHSTPSMMAMMPRVCQPTRYTRPFFSRLRTGQRSGHERRDHNEKRPGIRERCIRQSTGVNQQEGSPSTMQTCSPHSVDVTCRVSATLGTFLVHTISPLQTPPPSPLSTHLVLACFIRAAILGL